MRKEDLENQIKAKEIEFIRENQDLNELQLKLNILKDIHKGNHIQKYGPDSDNYSAAKYDF